VNTGATKSVADIATWQADQRDAVESHSAVVGSAARIGRIAARTGRHSCSIAPLGGEQRTCRSSLRLTAEAFDTIVDFLESFECLADPRQRGRVLYPLDEVLLLVLRGVIAGCESWVEIARYGDKNLTLLRRFRPFKDETPSHDQLGDIFAVLDAEQFQTCFVAWVTSLAGLGPEIVAIDGKTSS
jgi:hypothetical protein